MSLMAKFRCTLQATTWNASGIQTDPLSEIKSNLRNSNATTCAHARLASWMFGNLGWWTTAESISAENRPSDTENCFVFRYLIHSQGRARLGVAAHVRSMKPHSVALHRTLVPDACGRLRTRLLFPHKPTLTQPWSAQPTSPNVHETILTYVLASSRIRISEIRFYVGKGNLSRSPLHYMWWPRMCAETSPWGSCGGILILLNNGEETILP